MEAYHIRNLTRNRGCPRLWLQNKIPRAAGFHPRSRYAVDIVQEGDGDSKVLCLRLTEDGHRVVTGAVKGNVEIPIIDLNSAEVLGMFDGMEQVRVVVLDNEIRISALATEIRIQERLKVVKDAVENGEPIKVGSMSHGGGVLSKAIHDGLELAGHKAKLMFANDIDYDMLEHASSVNPVWTEETQFIAAPMQEWAYDHRAMAKVSKVSVLELGIPCNGASISGRSKGGLDCAEAHPLVGHLLTAFLSVVGHVNPAVIVLENVPQYLHSASMWIIRHQLRDMGYVTHEMVLDASDWNCIERRERMCMVAVTRGMEFSWDMVEKPVRKTRHLGEFLEDIPDDSPMWRTMDYLKEKEIRDKAAGKGFAMQILGPESTKVGTIGKGYQKNRSTEPKVVHPKNPELLRLLTPTEHARIKNVDPALIQDLPLGTAHGLLGQGIVPAPFVAVGKSVGHVLTATAMAYEAIRKARSMSRETETEQLVSEPEKQSATNSVVEQMGLF